MRQPRQGRGWQGKTGLQTHRAFRGLSWQGKPALQKTMASCDGFANKRGGIHRVCKLFRHRTTGLQSATRSNVCKPVTARHRGLLFGAKAQKSKRKKAGRGSSQGAPHPASFTDKEQSSLPATSLPLPSRRRCASASGCSGTRAQPRCRRQTARRRRRTACP